VRFRAPLPNKENYKHYFEGAGRIVNKPVVLCTTIKTQQVVQNYTQRTAEQ
jgi:hypothetical protein